MLDLMVRVIETIVWEIKITEISGPFAGAGLKPVCPADGWVQHLPVIQEILRELTDNIEFISEH